MTMMHNVANPRSFLPSGRGGGSRKGKPYLRWPWVFKVVIDAVLYQWKGSEEAWYVDRRSLPRRELLDRVERAAPGMIEYRVQAVIRYNIEREAKGLTSFEEPTPIGQLNLGFNRVYKMYYDGTSARGRNHDPRTRASQSREHWRKHVLPGTALTDLWETVSRGGSAEGWLSLL